VTHGQTPPGGKREGTVHLALLRDRVRGPVVSFDDPSYERVRRSMVWNQLAPDRYPGCIVTAVSENDVIEAVRFARANGMRVAVRGGGHSWVGFSLRDESLLIDLGLLNHAAVHSDGPVAVIQPGIDGGTLNRLLEERGLAFPVGHCPSVPMSGYLLSGGLGWNFNNWLPACFSIEAARVVTADGHVIVANEERNPDLFWAVRGGGPGFFGVVTEYSLRLYPVPRAITTSNYYYPADAIEAVGDWAGAIAHKLPRAVELAVSIGPAPPAIAGRSQSGGQFVCSLTATAFLDDPAEAAAALALLDDCPVIPDSLLAERERSTPISVLYQMGGLSSWRYPVD
jgi:FAD/FMN-containing dehydrogenase